MSAPTLYRYALPNVNYEGWAVFLLDSNGLLTVASDYGDYVYHWPKQGWGKGDFRRFLLRCDDGYLIGKLGKGRSVFSPENTERLIKEDILQYRRCGQYTKEFARREWDLVNDTDWSWEGGRYDWYQQTELPDASEFMCHSPEPQLLGFMKRVWPRFRKVLEEALAAETEDSVGHMIWEAP